MSEEKKVFPIFAQCKSCRHRWEIATGYFGAGVIEETPWWQICPKCNGESVLPVQGARPDQCGLLIAPAVRARRGQQLAKALLDALLESEAEHIRPYWDPGGVLSGAQLEGDFDLEKVATCFLELLSERKLR